MVVFCSQEEVKGPVAVGPKDPKIKILAQRFISPGGDKGQGIGGTDRRHGMREKWEGTRERGGRDIRPTGTKEEIDTAHRQMVVYKGKGGNPWLGGFGYFDWAC